MREKIQKALKEGKGRKIIWLLMLAEVVAALSLAGMIFRRNLVDTRTSITDWQSKYTTYDDGWYADEKLLKTDTTVDFIYGPYIDLKKGAYSFTIEYECDSDQEYTVYTMTENKDCVKNNPGKLRNNQNHVSHDFFLTDDVEDLEVVVKYDGQGAVRIKDIEIEPDTASLRKELVIVIFLFAIIDLCVYFLLKRKRVWMRLALEAGIVVFFVIAIIVQQKENREAVDISITDWNSKYVTYDDGWSIDEKIGSVEFDSEIEEDTESDSDEFVWLQGPEIALGRGTYSVKVDYECDEDQACQAYANSPDGAYLEAGQKNILSKNQTGVQFDFTLKEEISNFQVLVMYNGAGKFKVNNIEIYHTSAGLQRMLTIVILLILCLNLCFYFRKYIREHKLLILKLCGMILLVSCPLLVKGINVGHDLTFHLMRIEGLAEELRNGVFPVKLSSLWMDGYGYPVSVFYGDLLLYIVAVLRIIGFTVITAYKSYVLLINAGTVIIAYVCFKKVFKDSDAALLTAFAYTTAGYRIVNIYVRAAVGEYSAMMFFPVVALAVYQFYTLDAKEWKAYQRYALVLALGMTGVIGSHILSVEVVFFTLAVLCIVLWKSTLKKYVFRGYLLAVIETIVLNMYFIVPFLDYYRNADVHAGRAVDYIKTIQWYGAYIGQYFSFFKNMFGSGAIDPTERLSLTPGLPLMAVLMIAAVIWVKGKATKETKLYFCFSVFLLFLASNSFPWNHLTLNCRLINLIAQVQFPWRYLGIASVFLTLLLGNIWGLVKKEESCRKGFYVLTVGSCFIMMLFYISNYSDEAWMIYYYDTAEISTYSQHGGEYLRIEAEPGDFSGEIVHRNMQKVQLLSREGTHMELYCESSESEGIVELPMLNYKGYRVTDEYGKRYEITDSKNALIQFTLPAGFSGEVMIDFVEPWYWRLAEAVSLIAVIMIAADNMLRYRSLRVK